MRKVKMFMAVLIVGVTVAGTSLTSEAAGCGKWYISSVEKPSCKRMSCGPGQALPLYQQKLNWKRKCVRSDNTVKYEKKYTFKGLGCC